MAKYVYRNGKFICKTTGEPMNGPEDKARFNRMLKSGRGPLITADIQDYQSPVTGEWISGRAARREDLIKNDCFEIDPPSKPLRERQKAKQGFKLEESRDLNNHLDAVADRAGLK